MEKVIVNRENYEEVMFGLLENEYSAEVQKDILDQIKTDVFLSFEWEQWKKSFYTESIEEYRFENIEFIESLIKKEPLRIGFYAKRGAIAASMILLIVMFFLLRENKNHNLGIAKNQRNRKVEKAGEYLKQETANQKTINSKNNTLLGLEVDNRIDRNTIIKDTVAPLKLLPDIPEKLNVTKIIDSIKAVYVNAPIAKKPRYNISIQTDDASQSDMQYANIEKRYTIKDLENKKDGITIQKFLIGSKSRIVNNVANNTRVLELYTSDNCVLEINLLK